jgi:hypothetical protein
VREKTLSAANNLWAWAVLQPITNDFRRTFFQAKSSKKERWDLSNRRTETVEAIAAAQETLVKSAKTIWPAALAAFQDAETVFSLEPDDIRL